MEKTNKTIEALKKELREKKENRVNARALLYYYGGAVVSGIVIVIIARWCGETVLSAILLIYLLVVFVVFVLLMTGKLTKFFMRNWSLPDAVMRERATARLEKVGNMLKDWTLRQSNQLANLYKEELWAKKCLTDLSEERAEILPQLLWYLAQEAKGGMLPMNQYELSHLLFGDTSDQRVSSIPQWERLKGSLDPFQLDWMISGDLKNQEAPPSSSWEELKGKLQLNQQREREVSKNLAEISEKTQAVILGYLEIRDLIREKDDLQAFLNETPTSE